MTIGGWTFFGREQGLTSGDVHDVSPDEGGNVYVAGGDALYAKRRDAPAFLRFDAATGGLTANCHAPEHIADETPPDAPFLCPVISVGGAKAGHAYVGFKGVGTDLDSDADWAMKSGGADAVAFDGTAIAKERHVLIASPPRVICEDWLDAPANTVCHPYDQYWTEGRMKTRQVLRIAVNHDASRPMSYGDVAFGSPHANVTILMANPAARGALDYTRGDPAWADAKWIWEHEHAAVGKQLPSGWQFLTGEGWALAFDPIGNVPWFANQFRIARLPEYATRRAPTWNGWWGPMEPNGEAADSLDRYIWLWRRDADPLDASGRDNVSALSFCRDGTLWAASWVHGLARILRDGSWSHVPIPDPASNGAGARAVACDWADGSIWVGLHWGGVLRLKDGQWSRALPQGAPALAMRPVWNIQIDRWSSPRVVYFAHRGGNDRSGVSQPGGVSAYAGP